MFYMWKLVRIWILFSWCFLTVGILLGSWWAYHELGWGGWWFWDPVENASLMPWLLATACIHSITKAKLNFWTLICAQTTFILSILGTFFVRSGLLSSVHSFATDSTRGLYLLLFLFLIISISVFNWISCCKTARSLVDQRPVFHKFFTGSKSSKTKRVWNWKFASHTKKDAEKKIRTEATICKQRKDSDPNRTFVGVRSTKEKVRFMWYDHGVRNVIRAATRMLKIGSIEYVRDNFEFSESMTQVFSRAFKRVSLLTNKTLSIPIVGKTNNSLNLTVPSPNLESNGTFKSSFVGPLFSKQSNMKRSLEQILFLQNIYLYVICIVIFFGTSAPIVFQCLWNRDVGTGAPFYNGTLIPLFTSIFFVLAFVNLRFLQFNISNKRNLQKKTSITIPDRYTKVPSVSASPVVPGLNNDKYRTQAPLGSNRVVINPLILYSIFFFCLHVLIGALVIGLNFLDSIYAGICFLLISTIFISSGSTKVSNPAFNLKLPFHSDYKLKAFITDLFRLPSRHLVWTPLLKFGDCKSTGVLGAQSGARYREMNIAHTGIVLFIAGILLSNTFKFEFTEQLHSGPLGIRLGSQICCLRSIDHSFAPTFHSICANLLVYQQPTPDCTQNLVASKLKHPHHSILGNISSTQQGLQSMKLSFNNSLKIMQSEPAVPGFAICMFPEKRFYYSDQGAIATKVAIHSNMFTDFYSLIGTGSIETGWFTTIMKLPFIFCIWLGFLFGVIGGFLSLRKQLKKSKLNWV